jgi:hypothetical protein
MSHTETSDEGCIRYSCTVLSVMIGGRHSPWRHRMRRRGMWLDRCQSSRFITTLIPLALLP